MTTAIIHCARSNFVAVVRVASNEFEGRNDITSTSATCEDIKRMAISLNQTIHVMNVHFTTNSKVNDDDDSKNNNNYNVYVNIYGRFSSEAVS
jgi:hypothetical protein